MKRKYDDNEYDTLTNVEYVSSKSIRNITNIRTLPSTNSENEKGKHKSVSVRRT